MIIIILLMLLSFAFGIVVATVWALSAPQVFCKMGFHLVVEEGGGMMGDCLRCLVCGRDKYPENFGVACTVLDIKKVRKLE